MYYILDWDKVIKIIFEKNLAWMRAGLNGDWDNTAGTILKNGEPVPKSKIEPTFFSASRWAIPAIEYYSENEGKIVRENCFYTSNEPLGEPSEPWPIDYLQQFWDEKYKEDKGKIEVQDDRAQSKEDIHLKPKKNSIEDSISFKNSLKAIEDYSRKINDELKRIFRMVPYEEMSEETKKRLSDYFDDGIVETVDETSSREWLEYVFESAAQRLKEELERLEEGNDGSIKSEKEILSFASKATDFLCNFRNLLEGYLTWKIGKSLEINEEDLKSIVGGKDFN